jgi:hypothetical protein
MKQWRLLTVLAAAAIAAVVPAMSLSARSAWSVSLVASGLDSPRGLAFAPNGTLYLAEGGHGGDACNPSPRGPLCIGTTSRISRVDTTSGSVTPVVSGLFSVSTGTDGITGVDDVAASGGKLIAVMTGFPQQFASFACSGQPTDCSSSLAAARDQAGDLITFTPGGTRKTIANVGTDDFTWSLTHTSFTRSPPNSNPYGVFGVPAGAYVADAGTNVLTFVKANGDHTIISVDPLPAAGGFPGDGVPTCVTVVRGNLYAADLAGRLWKRNGSFTPTQVTAGTNLIHHVTGCASDKSGDIFLVDMWGTPGPPIPAGPASVANTGSVVELRKDGTATTIASGLDFPNGIAIAKDGSLYVTTKSICTAQGTPLPSCGQGGQLVHLKPS